MKKIMESWVLICFFIFSFTLMMFEKNHYHHEMVNEKVDNNFVAVNVIYEQPTEMEYSINID